ncbi:MAG: anti-sigma factor [Saprospiraceae bacterium]|nr:anti-sigma factor [Saprospiraceae bacterium]
MIKDVDKFLDSHLLEDYILGVTTVEESSMVEEFIASSEKVRTLYNELQENIEWVARKSAIKAPDTAKQNILSRLEQSPLTVAKNSNFRVQAIAASVAALICAFAALNYWSKDKKNSDLLADMNTRLEILEEENNAIAQQLTTLEFERDYINDAGTERYVLTGNAKAEGFISLAYWNRDQRKAFVMVNQLPQLGSDKCLQMWADVDGEMLNVGILPEQTNGWVEVNFLEDAESLNITIEPAGGSDHPTVADLVANVII